MTRLISLIVSTILLLAGVVYAEPVVVKIGATLPLTGRLAIAGEDVRHGIELAIKEFSSSSVKLEAVFADNQHDAKMAVVSAKKLLDLPKNSLRDCAYAWEKSWEAWLLVRLLSAAGFG